VAVLSGCVSRWGSDVPSRFHDYEKQRRVRHRGVIVGDGPRRIPHHVLRGGRSGHDGGRNDGGGDQ